MSRMRDFQIDAAAQADHEILTRIAIESKRHWKYPEEWIFGWLEDLTISPKYIEKNYVFKLSEKANGTIIGFCALEWREDTEELEVAHLWLKSRFIGKGLGKQLLEYGLKSMEQLPVRTVRVTSDPNALGFYKKFGFKENGFVESTPKGRLLPTLVFYLS